MTIEESIKVLYLKRPIELSSLQESIDKAICALEKQIEKHALKSKYCEESDCFLLLCPNCEEPVGSLDNEDGDGIYKFNFFDEHCHKCGQKIKQIYQEV